jgi:topoisomerase-4 subunit A
MKVWYDDSVQRLNTDERGILLGDFSGDDRIITFMQSGAYRITSFDLSTHFDEDMMRIEKFDPERIYSVVYQESDTKHLYVKRFTAELTEKRVEFIDTNTKLVLLTDEEHPEVDLLYDMKQKSKGTEEEIVDVAGFIGVKGVKAKGKRLTTYAVKKVTWIEHEIPEEETDEEPDQGEEEEIDVNDQQDESGTVPVAKDDGQMELPL